MCSPQVIAQVGAACSRRRFLGVAGGVALGAAVAPRATLGQQATPVVSPEATPAAVVLPAFTTVLDLTHTVSPDFPVFPGTQALEITPNTTIEEDGFRRYELLFNEHVGTHMDAPAHFIVDGETADNLAVERLFAPLAVIDISARAADDPDAAVTVDDLVEWESANGQLPPGAFVAMYSGWETRLADPATFLNADESDVLHFPGFDGEAAAFLTTERDIVGIGVDTLSLDIGASADFATHLTVLGAGKYGVESLANLSTVPAAGATVIVGGPKHLDATGGPTRAFAVF